MMWVDFAALAMALGASVLGFWVSGSVRFLPGRNAPVPEANRIAKTLELDAGNAAETLHVVAWMEDEAPSTLALWRDNYANWKGRQA